MSGILCHYALLGNHSSELQYSANLEFLLQSYKHAHIDATSHCKPFEQMMHVQLSIFYMPWYICLYYTATILQ